MILVSKLGLFSSNETVDDVSTINLKYILVPFYLGELTEKLAKEGRIEILKMSQAQLKEFTSICEALELVSEEEIKSSKPGSTDLAAARSKKAWLTEISLAICKAFDLLDMLKKEEQMLVALKEQSLQNGNFAREVLNERSQKAEMWYKTAASRAPFLKPAQPITCATFAQDVIEGRAEASQVHEHKHQPMIFGPVSLIGGRLTSERERMAAPVFQPGYRMPTMSIEEAGLREMEIMNNWQERNTKLMEEANSSWHGDRTARRENGDDEDDDEAQERARAWDDWKDDHPRGAGNKKLTPCG